MFAPRSCLDDDANLFDQGDLTVTPERQLKVSPRLRIDYENGATYYPMDNQPIAIPREQLNHPNREYLIWHNDNVYRS